MRIVVFEAAEWERQAFARLSPPHVIACVKAPLTADNVAAYADAEAVTTFIRSDLSEPVLRALPRLRLIATRSTGFDHIDLEYCRQTAVTVCNVPDYGDRTVAEYVFALLLALSRRIVEAANRTRHGDFSTADLSGFDLGGKTLGIVGTGRIGRRVAAIARGFGMSVVAFDVRPDPHAAETLGFRYAPMDELLATSDVVTLHVPGDPGGRHVIGPLELDRIKPGAVLINTSRGGVVDTEALVRALTSGRLAAAGLDVVTEERALGDEAEIFRSETELPAARLRALVADHALLRLPSVLITPHIAYDTREAVQRILDTTLENIAAFDRLAPQNRVA